MPIILGDDLNTIKVQEALGSWLKERMDDVADVTVSELSFPEGNGSSNLTGLFTA